MIFFIINYIIAWLQAPSESKRTMQYIRLLRSHYKYKSIIIGKKKYLEQNTRVGSRLSALLHTKQNGLQENIVKEEKDTLVATVSPNIQISLGRWTSYLDQQKYNPTTDEGVCHVLISLVDPSNAEEFIDNKLSLPSDKIRMVQEFVKPIAWKSAKPFGIIAESSIDKLGNLMEAFIDGNLFMEEPLDIQELTTIDIGGHAANLLRTASNPGPFELEPPTPNTASLTDLRLVDEPVLEGRTRTLSLVDEVQFDQTNHSIASFGSGDVLEDGSQGLDREAWSEMSDTDPTISGCAVIMEGSSAAGEALSEPVEILAPEEFTPFKRRGAHTGKPPNVLIYCGKKDSRRLYEGVKAVFEQCLNPDKYVIYHLPHNQVFTTPWMENTTLLITSGSKVYDDVDKAFLKFFQQGGYVLSFSSMYSCLFMNKIEAGTGASVLTLNYRQWKNVTVISGRHFFDDSSCLVDDVSLSTLARDKSGGAVIVEANHDISGGVTLISQAKLDKDPVLLAISPDIFAALKKANPTRFEILNDLLQRLGVDCQQGNLPDLTPSYLISTSDEAKDELLGSLRGRLRGGVLRSKEIALKFITYESEIANALEQEILPVVKEADVSSKGFNFGCYKKHLKTRTLGNTVFYTPVIKTTMTVFDGLMFSVPESVGLIAIATRQTVGKGRGGNAWISPVGCSMFSLHVKIDLNSELGQKVAYLQHIASLAVVEAVRSIPGYEDINLRLKWPNDIYFGNTMKLGGVIVNSSCMQTQMHANIGCGVNVSNKDPTICINDLIRRHNHTEGTSLPELSIEEMIGRTVSKVEEIINLFQTKGMDSFLDLYYKRWLHGDATVYLEAQECDAKVVGLDDYGFLRVQTQEGPVSVHPDGNSFDIMKNLIIPKSR